MLESLNERLMQVKEQQRKKQKWESQLEAYQNEASEKQHERERLEEQLKDEEKDVEKLENPSLTNLFYTVIGKKEDRLDKEKQELLTAHLKYDETIRAIDHIGAAIKDLRKNLETLPNVDAIYQEILLEKERLVQDAGSPLTEEYFALSHQIADLNAEKQETEEAIQAGEAVLSSLEQALNSLDKAEDWGTFDLFGGGMITTAIKHNNIDDAKEWIHQAQSDMRAFQKELADIHLDEDMDVDISGLLTFADYFFDGFITDWMVQGRIEDSIEKVENQSEEINQFLNQLRDNTALINQNIESATAARTELLENA